MDRRQLTAARPEEREPVFDQIRDALRILHQDQTFMDIAKQVLADGDLTSRSEEVLRTNFSVIAKGRYRKGPPTDSYFFGQDLAEQILDKLRTLLPQEVLGTVQEQLQARIEFLRAGAWLKQEIVNQFAQVHYTALNHAVTGSSTNAQRWLDRLNTLPRTPPEAVLMARNPSGVARGKKAWETRKKRYPINAEVRLALFQDIRSELTRLSMTETFSDLAPRVLSGDASLSRLKADAFASLLRKIAAGHTQNGYGSFPFAEERGRLILGILRELGSVVSETANDKSRRLYREKHSTPSTDAGLGKILEWAAECVREWQRAGVGGVPLSRRLAEQGVTVHATKLSRLSVHGPVRQDRPDTYLMSQEVAVALVTGLTKLGQPPQISAAA